MGGGSGGDGAGVCRGLIYGMGNSVRGLIQGKWSGVGQSVTNKGGIGGAKGRGKVGAVHLS